MGEVEGQVERPLTDSSGWRDRFFRWAFPDHMEQLQVLENDLFETTQGLTLKLQRANQQIRGLTQDVGQYRDRWANLVSGDYNPDTIGIAEYKKMLDYDSQVIAGFDLIQMGVLMKPWKIVHKDPEIVNILTRALGSTQYPDIRDGMKQMLKAIAYGFSVTEVVFDDYKGKYWMPRQLNGLKTLDPESIRFFSDVHGNLHKIEQWNMTTSIGMARSVRRSSIAGRIVLPLDRCIVWSHDKEWGNWYGKGLLKGCYKNWFIKDAMLKFANIAYERFGSPVLLGIASSLGDMANVQNAIMHLYARSQAVIRKTDAQDPTDIRVLESKRTEMPFDRYIRYHDEMILRRMLIGQKIFEGGGGTYGPKVPLDIIFMRLADFRMELTAAMNHLLKMITDLNWIVEAYPKFEFAPLTTQDQTQISRGVYDAIDRGIISEQETWIRGHLGFPPAEEGAPAPTKKEDSEEESEEPEEEPGEEE